MLKDKNFWRIHIKWGIILGIFLSALEILKMFARKVDYQAGQLLDLAMIIGFILVLFYGVREFKDYYTGRLSFAKAFLSTITITIAGVAVLFCYDSLHYSVFEKDGLQKKYAVALDKYRNNLAKDTITAAELSAYTDTVSSIMNIQKDEYLSINNVADTLSSEINTGVLLFQQYYTKKILSRPESDREFYRLGEFSQYSRRVLMETLVSYYEQNESKSSTAGIQNIIQNTNRVLEGVDPLEKRFNETKTRVPRYDKTGNYAAVSGAMYLIYGMFFGLFVAMFHYRSKDPIEPVPDDDAEIAPEGQETEPEQQTTPEQ